jgi:4-amino-4-deoxy-L-arabinose transferase-like glycosyltransferase
MRFRGFAVPQRAKSARWGPLEAAIVVIAAVVLACVFTYPYIINFSNAGRLDTNDGRWSIWVVSWVAHALTTDPLQLFRANIFYPHPNALAFSEGNFVAGMIAIPAWLLTKNPYATHNFVFLCAFALSFVATYYLVRRLTGDRRAAILAAIMFAYCPFAFVRQAHIQLLLIGFLPWCMLAWHRFLDRTSLPRAIELGAVMALTGLACAYYGIFAGGMIAIASIWFAFTRGRWKDVKYWTAVAVAAVVCIGLITPFFLPYLQMQESTGFERPLSGQYSANFSAWLNSSAWAHRWWVPYLWAPSEGLFPGILAIVLGCWGATFVRERDGIGLKRDEAWFYIGLALFTFWLTLGPKAGLYTALYYTVPVFSFLRAPSRAGIVVTLCLVVLAAPALSLLMRRRATSVVFTILFVLVVADLYRAPLRMRTAPPLSTVYTTLARLPRGPVIELPYWSDNVAYHRHAEYMLLSTAHWQPLVNGYSDHIPQDFRDNALPLSGFPSRDSFAILENIGARYAVFHLNLMGLEARTSLVARLENDYLGYLRPLEKDGDVWLYEIVAWPR